MRLDPQNALVLANVARLNLGSGRLASAATSLTSGLSADAQQDTLHRLYDALVVTLIRRMYLIELIFGVVVCCLALARAPYVARAAAGLSMVLALTLGSWSILRRLPKGASSYTLSVTRRHRGAVGLLVVLAAVIGALVLVMSFGPSALTHSLLSVFKFGGFAVVLVVRILLAPFRAPRQRSDPPPNLRSGSYFWGDNG